MSRLASGTFARRPPLPMGTSATRSRSASGTYQRTTRFFDRPSGIARQKRITDRERGGRTATALSFIEQEEFPVSGLKKYLTGLVAFTMAMAAQQALAVIIVPRTFSADPNAYREAFDSRPTEFANLGDTSAGPVSPASPDDRHDRSPHWNLGSLLADSPATCNPVSTSSTNGSGGSAAAILNEVAHLEPSLLETSLPRDSAIILAAGPPFEILRPA